MTLAGKGYIVTGASRESAWQLSRSSLPAEHPSGLVHFHCGVDVSSRGQVTKTFDAILTHGLENHGLANSAGIAPDNLHALNHRPEPDEIFCRVLEVNLYGTWYVGSAYLNNLLHHLSRGDCHPGRSIVNLASASVLRTEPGMASYNTSKHAVVGLTMSWAKDFVGRGDRVNCVAPSMTDTPLVRQATLPPGLM
ncbi:hypothetical protein ASPCAL02409 [Aspergillus calidoustus]|uniref:Uncharacterized protein n=1 Tax=Aspergillus calidoustus TaxID=454130 RepID=A0A0U5GPP5_ASPCI|nr:hypothetical protein ASPCAL02409 [Aspergillus calidoustus]